jgi:hypothetical protein
VQVEWDVERKRHRARVPGIEAEGFGYGGRNATLALVAAMAGMIVRHGVGVGMRPASEIKADLQSTKDAYDAMICVVDAEPEGKGIFLENCVQRIRELDRELLAVEAEAKKPTAWEKVLQGKPSV